MAHLGYGGQVWYANANSGVVIVKMSTLDNFAAADADTGNATLDMLVNIDKFLSQQ